MGLTRYSADVARRRTGSRTGGGYPAEFIATPENISKQHGDWIDTFMGHVMTAGLCGSFTLLCLILLKSLLLILMGGASDA